MIRHFAAALAATVMVGAAGASVASDYPTRPIKIIVPFGPGGVTDLYAREVAHRLQPRLGQPFVIEHRPGQGGSLGASSVARAEPDGYTLLIGSNANTFGHTLYPDLKFDILSDFAPIARGTSIVNVFVVHPSFKGRSIKDVIALAKENPGKLSYASSGFGGGYHMTMELFKHMSGADIFHIPFRTESQGRTDVVAGRIDMMITAYAAAEGNIKGSQLRVLAVTSPSRFSVLPDIPTIAEAGVTGYDGDTWIGLLAPARTPQAVIARLHQEMVQIGRDEGFRAKLASLGLTTSEGSPEEFAAFMKGDVEKWRQVIRAAGIEVK